MFFVKILFAGGFGVVDTGLGALVLYLEVFRSVTNTGLRIRSPLNWSISAQMVERVPEF